MKAESLWKGYCSFYERPFQEQIEYNKKRMEAYFRRWRKTDLARMVCQGKPETHKDVPLTSYSDYPMLKEFGMRIVSKMNTNPKRRGELYRNYYDRMTLDVGSSLNRYMAEPFYFCMKSTGTTGGNKWIANGETFWSNFASGSIAAALVACSDGWGETKLEVGDKSFNMTAPIPYISGWGAWACRSFLTFIPPIEVTDDLQDMKETFSLILKAIQRGNKIIMGGGLGSMFYMLCKYFTDPEEFYEEYYHSMSFGLKKLLLYMKLLQCRVSRKDRRKITELIPLKGVILGGTETKLYIDFFKEEFNIEPLHAYGSTEAGNLMRGDPDRKTELVPDLRTSYLEFKTQDGDMKDLDELKMGETCKIVVTPFGSIVYRYDMMDLLRVVDFRDDGMPVFAFEGREKQVTQLYGYYVTPNIIVQALSGAGLGSSDKWAVAKLLKPREHLHFLMEKAWPYSEREAEKVIFYSLMETERAMPHRGRTLRDYVIEFRIADPSEVVKVEYLKPGAFLRYSMIRAKEGSPIGQYKPPKMISTEKMEIYETLRKA